jgi:hypothetical protein
VTRRGFRGRRSVDVGDAYRSASVCQAFGDGFADPGGGAGDESDMSLHIKHGKVLRQAVLRN